MHSKWKLWDFLRARPSVLTRDVKLIAFSCYDQLAFKLLRDVLKAKDFLEGERWNVLLGQEVSTDWVDSNLKSLDLFGNTQSHLVHDAQNLSPDIENQLLDVDDLLLQDCYLILNFTKENSFFKKLQKSDSPLIETIQIQSPSFWEENELLQFLSQLLNISLTSAAKNKIKEKIPFSITSYYQILFQIKINFEKSVNIDVDKILPLFAETKVDQFELANFFSSKKLNNFYEKILEYISKEYEIIGAVYFVQAHLIKMYDLSYLDSKSKLTKYDKQLLEDAKLWTQDELARALKYLGTILVMCKRKDFFLEFKLKSEYLRIMNF